MKKTVILDTGPLVALVDSRDKDHPWAVAQWGDIEPPLLTCESVISEACFLLSQIHVGKKTVFEMLSRKAIELSFRLEDHVKDVGSLLRKYSDIPMSVADACLVRMAEHIPNSAVLTLDQDFRIYRKHGRQVIPLIAHDRER
ncbi:MAG: PIN domain-containing protein [Acidobacteria bacterium]|nr:PIN domain-containing protein [Acidobacteriota bacterium]